MTGLLVVHSALESVKEAEARVNDKINKLTETNTSLNFMGYFNEANQIADFLTNRKDDYSSLIIFVSSGGTEEFVEIAVSIINKPVLLWAFPKNNSLAASLEVYSVLKESYSIKLYYENKPDELKAEVEKFVKVAAAINRVNTAKLGLIGEPSSWLLTSKGKNKINNFETSLVELDVKEIPKCVNEISSDSGLNIANELKGKFKSSSVKEDEVLDSSKVYLALKAIINKHQLNSLTVKCFDLLEHNYTACIGLSMCNDEDIVAGCEGDILTTFTMMIGSYITGRPAWMANPSSIDKKSNMLILAHCTIPTKMLADINESELVSHMESNKSTAIQGPLKRGEVTIFRVGGNFDKMLCVTGRIIETDMKDRSLCRTQAVIALDGNIDKWIESSVGNHQVVVYGDISEELRDFCKYTNLEFNLIED